MNEDDQGQLSPTDLIKYETAKMCCRLACVDCNLGIPVEAPRPGSAERSFWHRYPTHIDECNMSPVRSAFGLGCEDVREVTE